VVPWIYDVTQACSFGASALCFRLRVSGREHVPSRGACIVASNHASYLDPVVLGAASVRRLAFVARHELFDVPVLGAYIRALGAFPVRQEHAVDIESFRRALGILRRDEVVALFPEGTRSHDGRLQTGKGGVGVLAIKANVPVVPAYIAGTDRALPRAAKWIRCVPVSVRFGPPLRSEAFMKGGHRDGSRLMTEAVMQAIADLASSISIHPKEAVGVKTR